MMNPVNAKKMKAAVVAAVFLCFPWLLPAQNRVSERDNFHNTVYIKTDDEAVKTGLFQHGEALRRGNFPEAVTLLLRVLKAEGEALVPLGERTYMNVREVCLRRIASLPVDALRVYLDRAEEEASRFLNLAAAPLESFKLEEVAARYPLTPSAFAALRARGGVAFERGAYLEASRWYHRLCDDAAFLSGTDFPVDTALLQGAELSLYVALHLAGRPDEALAYKPHGLLKVGGETLDAARFIERLEKADHGDEVERAGWPTRGGHLSRQRLPDFDASDLVLRWSYPLQEEPVDRFRSLFDPLTVRFRDARRREASVCPIVFDDTLYVFNETALYPLDLETGKIRFGPLRWDWSLVFGGEPPDLESVAYSGTIENHVLFATFNRRTHTLDAGTVPLGVLLALDLEREGYALWMRGGVDERDPILGDVVFTGAPAVLAGRVFIMGTRYTGAADARAEAYLFGFDAASGKLLFSRFLCSGAEVSRFEIRLGSDRLRRKDRVELGSPAAERGGMLYCLTNLGVVAAVHAFTGEIRWLFKYNRIFSQNPDSYYRDTFIDTGGWKDGLPMLHGNLLYFTPEDSRFLYCLDVQPDVEGYIILDDPVEKARMISLIGMKDSRFYFTARDAGRNKILATEPNGAVLWESTSFEMPDRIAGRPLLTTCAVFAPTERYIYRIDLEQQGLVTHMFPMPYNLTNRKGTPAKFGNIIAIRDYLVSVSSEDVIVFKGIEEN